MEDDDTPELPEDFGEVVSATLAAQQGAADAIIMDCLREIFHSIPKGNEFTLSNGKTARLKTFIEPRYDTETGKYFFAIDVKIDDWRLDYLEFSMEKTGQGGFVAPPEKQ